MTAPRARTMRESDLMATIIEAARQLNYLVYHAYDARRSEPGFPDLVIVGHNRIFVIECKGAKGKLRPPTVDRKGRVLPGQAEWLAMFAMGGAEVAIVRPDGLDDALALLQEGYERQIA